MQSIFKIVGAAVIVGAVVGSVWAASDAYQRPGVGYTASSSERSSDYYVNVSGNLVHRPMFSATQPPGATAQCADGSWSFSQHRRGTCNYHGGVRHWLN